jgi:hypothetical protein
VPSTEKVYCSMPALAWGSTLVVLDARGRGATDDGFDEIASRHEYIELGGLHTRGVRSQGERLPWASGHQAACLSRVQRRQRRGLRGVASLGTGSKHALMAWRGMASTRGLTIPQCSRGGGPCLWCRARGMVRGGKRVVLRRFRKRDNGCFPLFRHVLAIKL